MSREFYRGHRAIGVGMIVVLLVVIGMAAKHSEAGSADLSVLHSMQSPSPTVTPSMTPTPEATPSPTPDVTPSPTPEATPSPTLSPTVSPTPTPDMSPTPMMGPPT